MKLDLDESIDVLERTPLVLRHLLDGLSTDWTASAGDEANWRPFDVIGHLIHGERTDWVPRARVILDQVPDRAFEPFDRLAQFEASEGKELADLLAEFEQLRRESLETLRSWQLTDAALELRGTHPELGEVKLSELLATWVVHDLNHIQQIVAAMARGYENEVGPWSEFLSILK